MTTKDTPESLVYELPYLGELIHVSRPTIYKLAREGKIPTLRFGRRLVVPKAQFLKMLEGTGPSIPS